MRVITGSAKGRALETLPGEDIVRPTSQRNKEVIFSAIQFEIEGRRALDAFAGSGQLGIEALSRGAAHCLFIDADKKALEICRKNIEQTKQGEKAKTMQADALQYMKHTAERFDIIFLDPPYLTNLLEESIDPAASILMPGGLLVCESPIKKLLPDIWDDVAMRKEYPHGKTKICVYQKAKDA